MDKGGVNLLEVFDPVAEQLIKPDEEPRKIAEGFVFTEGPVWSFAEGHLTFVDLVGNAMYRYKDGEGTASYRDPSDHANGLAYDRSGRLLSCEHRTRRITIESDGELDVLVDSFRGKKLNAPNDLLVTEDGSVIFTDPHYGLMEGYGGPGTRNSRIEASTACRRARTNQNSWSTISKGPTDWRSLEMRGCST